MGKWGLCAVDGVRLFVNGYSGSQVRFFSRRVAEDAEIMEVLCRKF